MPVRIEAAKARLEFEQVTLPHGLLRRWLAPLLSLLILFEALVQLRYFGFHKLIEMMPLSAAFWALFMINYFFQPVSELVIFRRLWNLPLRGIFPLLRKRLSNELLLGYSGEAYFYTWARQNVPMVTAPFGAVKDVAILSAAVANVVTLVLVAMCWPVLREIKLGTGGDLLVGSAAIITVGSLASMMLRRVLFSLPPRDLLSITVVHGVRMLGNLVLTAILWTMIMPAAPMSWWLLLVTLRMLVTRLPLVPNKDLVFAGCSALLIGRTADLTALVTLIAGLTLAMHLVVGCGLAALDLTKPEHSAAR